MKYAAYRLPEWKRRLYAKGIFAAVALGICLWGIPRLWHGFIGNAYFSYYGQAVDENGRGIANITVNAELAYRDDIPLPVMDARPEHTKKFSVTTDDNGMFEFTDLVGYGFSIDFHASTDYRLEDVGGPPYPDSSWVLYNRDSWAGLPDSPGKRRVSKMRV